MCFCALFKPSVTPHPTQNKIPISYRDLGGPALPSPPSPHSLAWALLSLLWASHWLLRGLGAPRPRPQAFLPWPLQRAQPQQRCCWPLCFLSLPEHLLTSLFVICPLRVNRNTMSGTLYGHFFFTAPQSNLEPGGEKS